MRRVLHGAQLVCRRYGVRLTYRRGETGYYVNVDGSLPAIQTCLGPLAPSVQGVADAVLVPLPRAVRSRIGGRVWRGYARGVSDITDDVVDVSAALGGTPNSLAFQDVEDLVLLYRLDGLTRILTLWNAQQGATAEQVLEDLHASFELLMGRTLGGQLDDRAFSEQASEMVRRRLMSESERAALVRIKDVRRNVRHHSASLSDGELSSLLEAALPLMHQLLVRINSQ